jgi:multidrug resistance efflux pump
MSSGFRYIFMVLVIAAAVFAGLSLWPALLDALSNGKAQAAPGVPAVAPPLAGGRRWARR